MFQRNNLRINFRKKFSSFISILLVLIVIILTTNGCAARRCFFPGTPVKPEEVFDQVVDIVNANYIDKSGNKVNLDTRKRPDVSTILTQLDSTSIFYSPEQVSIIENCSCGSTGLLVALKDNVLEIRGTFPMSPAREAGLRRGDKITAINGIPISGPSVVKMIGLLQGDPGSEVMLKIITRSGNEKTVRLVREVIKTPQTIAECFVEGKIGYIRIDRFGHDTYGEVQQAIKRLLKKDMNGLIIDVRNNTGGILRPIANVAALFLNSGKVITTLKGGHGEKDDVFRNPRNSPYNDFPIVVLIDGHTSSGAEIFAASLRDNERASLVGVKSAGVIDIKEAFSLKDGSQLRIRTKLAYSPKEKLIDGHGVEPDLNVNLTKEEYEALYERMADFPDLKSVDIVADRQLKMAVSTIIEKSKK